MTATEAHDFAHDANAVERRKEKARALGRNLWLNGYTAQAAGALSDADWAAVARAAGKNPPSDETQQMAARWADWLWRKDGPPPVPEPVPEPVQEHVQGQAPVVHEAPKVQVRKPGTCLHVGCPHVARLYAAGWLCDEHSPWKMRGLPFQDEVKAAADRGLEARLLELSQSQP